MAATGILTWLTYAAIVAMIVAYALERWSIEVVSLSALVGWLVLFWAVPMLMGVKSPLGPDELLAGLSNQALITVLAMLVVGQGLFHTDALERPAAFLARLGGKTGMGAILLVLVAAMVTSAFVNDTPVVVMFLPIITAIAASRGIATSKALMPLSFAALLGGMTTLIGTSTNLLAAGVAQKSGGLDNRLLRFHGSRGRHGGGRFRLCRLRAAAHPEGAHGHGRTDHRRQRQAVHRHHRDRLRPSAGRRLGGRRHVPGPQGHDGPPRPAPRAPVPAALRKPDAAARRHHRRRRHAVGADPRPLRRRRHDAGRRGRRRTACSHQGPHPGRGGGRAGLARHRPHRSSRRRSITIPTPSSSASSAAAACRACSSPTFASRPATCFSSAAPRGDRGSARQPRPPAARVVGERTAAAPLCPPGAGHLRPAGRSTPPAASARSSSARSPPRSP